MLVLTLHERENPIGAAKAVRSEVRAHGRREVVEHRIVRRDRERVAGENQDRAGPPGADRVDGLAERDDHRGAAVGALFGPAEPHAQVLGEGDDVPGADHEGREREPVHLVFGELGTRKRLLRGLPEMPVEDVSVALLVGTLAPGDDERLRH